MALTIHEILTLLAIRAILAILAILAIIHRGLQVALRSAGGATYVCRTPTINIRATLIWLFEPA